MGQKFSMTEITPSLLLLITGLARPVGCVTTHFAQCDRDVAIFAIAVLTCSYNAK